MKRFYIIMLCISNMFIQNVFSAGSDVNADIKDSNGFEVLSGKSIQYLTDISAKSGKISTLLTKALEKYNTSKGIKDYNILKYIAAKVGNAIGKNVSSLKTDQNTLNSFTRPGKGRNLVGGASQAPTLSDIENLFTDAGVTD